MKKIALLFAAFLMFNIMQAQVITDKTSKKISVGFELFTDLWLDSPADMKVRGINQGFSMFATYNFPLGETTHTFSLGTGLRSHNLYSNSTIADIYADEIEFTKIEHDYDRSKLNVTYLDFPAEFRLRFQNSWKVGIGFKLGILMDSKTKYIGKVEDGGPTVRMKLKKVNHMEQYTYGPTLRIGYKMINLFAYYQIPSIFQTDLGPEMAPFSIGLSFSSF